MSTREAPPQGLELVRVVLSHIGSHEYDGGVNGTCYECPFASAPLEQSGRIADWHDIGNDPTEAWFRCALPGRDNEAVAWGEYAPCTEKEWAAAALEALKREESINSEVEAPLAGTKLDTGNILFSDWNVEKVGEAIATGAPILLIDGAFANPAAVRTWEAADVGAERLRREKWKEKSEEWDEKWRRWLEAGPQRGSPAWIEQKPFGTRWFYEMFGPR